MKKIFLLFLLANKAFGMSYIDNPNFDLYLKGWVCIGAHELITYDEEDRNRIFSEKYVVAKNCYYELQNVPLDVALYYTVEVGFHDIEKKDSQRQIRVEIVEMWNGQFTSIFSILTTTLVKLLDENSWHVINSVYPVYRKNENSTLSFIVASEHFQEIHLNYAQVGLDPMALGGRGPRPRQLDSSKNDL